MRWRIRKSPVAGWWAEFQLAPRRRWRVILGSPFDSRTEAEEAVVQHQLRAL